MKRHWPWLILVPAVLFVVIRGLSPGRPLDLEKQELLRIHEEILRAHRENDLPAWMGVEGEALTVVSRGEILHPSAGERERSRKAYLESTSFTRYEDLVPPQVVVSEDGSLGWLVCRVRMEGVQRQADGGTSPVEATWAWVELYEKREGRWRLVGNASTREPTSVSATPDTSSDRR